MDYISTPGSGGNTAGLFFYPLPNVVFTLNNKPLSRYTKPPIEVETDFWLTHVESAFARISENHHNGLQPAWKMLHHWCQARGPA